jgi:alpha,alpha-trehalose phosphorylase (configuration-retaining)
VYLQDFSVKTLELDGSEESRQDIVTDYIIKDLSSYERKIFAKFIGAGVPDELMKMAPKLCSRLWAELDIVPITTKPGEESHSYRGNNTPHWDMKNVDEQADSMARKCIM